MTAQSEIDAALQFIASLCHDKEGWEFSDSEALESDEWGADKLLIFNREDYVVCYVGFRQGAPLYVLQRIE